MFPVFSSICSNSKEMGNTSIYSQMSCGTQNVIVFHTCAQNCCCPCKSQQLDMDWECCGPFLAGVTQVESLLLFPFHSVLSGRAEAAQGWSSLLFSFVFLLRVLLQKLHFAILKLLQGKLQISACMEQHHSTGLPVTKKKNLKILRLGEMAVFDSSLISNYESR